MRFDAPATGPWGFRPLYPKSNQASQPDFLRLRPSSKFKSPVTHSTFGPSVRWMDLNMPSADFCRPIPPPFNDSSTGQIGRPPRVMRTHLHAYAAASTSMPSVQVSDFEDTCLLIRHDRLVCDFCSSSQRFACGFLQIPPRDGHPCRPANSSPCRVCRGLAPPSECALPGAQGKKPHP